MKLIERRCMAFLRVSEACDSAMERGAQIYRKLTKFTRLPAPPYFCKVNRIACPPPGARRSCKLSFALTVRFSVTRSKRRSLR
jgi:hypothetical protein